MAKTTYFTSVLKHIQYPSLSKMILVVVLDVVADVFVSPLHKNLNSKRAETFIYC